MGWVWSAASDGAMQRWREREERRGEERVWCCQMECRIRQDKTEAEKRRRDGEG